MLLGASVCRKTSSLQSTADAMLDEMRQLATEVRDFVQSRVGTTEFSRAWEKLRRRVSERREGRKDARDRLVSLVRRYGCKTEISGFCRPASLGGPEGEAGDDEEGFQEA